jgi:hypothetical protein
MDELVKTMSKKEAKDLVEWNIEKLSERIEDRYHFGLNLDKFDDWDKFKEIFHRRIIVVHNYGFPDSTYVEKTKFKGEIGEWLETDNTYINESCSIFENYANEIANFFHQKYAHDNSDQTQSRPYHNI